jgi:hypothetical protein
MYQGSGTNACFDTMDLSQTQDLLPTVDTLHELRSSVQGIITAWTRFSASQLEWLKATEYGVLADSIQGYTKSIEAHITELERHKQFLDDRCFEFEGRLNRVSCRATYMLLNAANVHLDHECFLVATQRECRFLTELPGQSRTWRSSVGGNGFRMCLINSCLYANGLHRSQFFLGLNLVVAIFGMNMVSQNTHPAWPVVSLLLVAGISYWLTTNPGVLDHLFPIHEEKLNGPGASSTTRDFYELRPSRSMVSNATQDDGYCSYSPP